MKFEESMENAEVELSPQIAKRKRTRRPRIGVCGSSSTEDHRNYESSVTTEEDEDMAKCLILLARSDELLKTRSIDSNYECKTCDKSFQSFQALGGHRASHHKKPRLSATDLHQPVTTTTTIKPSTTDRHSSKVHQCSICGSAFSSGQALGGHMRRHRSAAAGNDNIRMEAVELEPPALLVDNNNFLASLDLNLPAPSEEEEDHRRSRFIHQQFTENSSNPSTTAPPLVGCYL